jgi:Big-like domain-containing protein
MVKITSPTKGQQIPVHSSLTVTGTSIANSTSAICQVSVIANGIKSYQKAAATGHDGANDYSTWSYRLNPIFAINKQGQK